jgi:hypothetical protein
MVSRSHPCGFYTESLSFSGGCYLCFLLAGGLRPNYRRKYGVLLTHAMYQSEAVRKPTAWYMIAQMIVALRRTIAATTTLALYSITSGAFSLFVL